MRLFQSDKACPTDWKFNMYWSESCSEGILTSPTIPPCPGCSFAQSVRDLDLTMGCQRLGQINMCWGNRRCVCPSIFVCMCTGANLLWGGSTRISIIRGLWGPPLSPLLRFTSLSHHPSAALPPIHLPPSTQPPSPSYLSILPSVSILPLDPSLIQHFHSPPWPHPLTLILIITFYIVGI